MEYDAFISYSHRDQAFVDTLGQRLKGEAGLQVWWFQEHQRGGAEIRKEINRQIVNAPLLVLIFPPQAQARIGS